MRGLRRERRSTGSIRPRRLRSLWGNREEERTEKSEPKGASLYSARSFRLALFGSLSCLSSSLRPPTPPPDILRITPSIFLPDDCPCRRRSPSKKESRYCPRLGGNSPAPARASRIPHDRHDPHADQSDGRPGAPMDVEV